MGPNNMLEWYMGPRGLPRLSYAGAVELLNAGSAEPIVYRADGGDNSAALYLDDPDPDVPEKLRRAASSLYAIREASMGRASKDPGSDMCLAIWAASRSIWARMLCDCDAMGVARAPRVPSDFDDRQGHLLRYHGTFVAPGPAPEAGRAAAAADGGAGDGAAASGAPAMPAADAGGASAPDLPAADAAPGRGRGRGRGRARGRGRGRGRAGADAAREAEAAEDPPGVPDRPGPVRARDARMRTNSCGPPPGRP